MIVHAIAAAFLLLVIVGALLTNEKFKRDLKKIEDKFEKWMNGEI